MIVISRHECDRDVQLCDRAQEGRIGFGYVLHLVSREDDQVQSFTGRDTSADPIHDAFEAG